MYCPRRFALLEINDDWSENYFVVKANLIHQHVHDGSHSFSDSTKVVRSDIAVYNDMPEYDLFGVMDCIEFVKDSKGVKIQELDGNFKVRIIEYKPERRRICPIMKRTQYRSLHRKYAPITSGNVTAKHIFIIPTQEKE